MKTPIRTFLLVFFFISFYIPSSQAIIRTKSAISTPNYTFQKVHKKTFKERFTAFIIKKSFKNGFPNIDQTQKQSKSRKIVNIVLLSILGLISIYFLQGTLWLSVVGLLGLFIFLKHKKHEKHKNDPIKPSIPKESPTDDKPVVVTYKNSYARKSLMSFLRGLGSLLGAFVSIFLLILGSESIIPFVVFFGFILLSLIFFISSISRAAKSLKQKEPDSDESIIWLVLSILLLIPVLIFLTAFLASV